MSLYSRRIHNRIGGVVLRDHRWIRFGGIAGILYVAIALVGGTLPGATPPADGKAITYQNYFIAKQDLLVVQGWLFPLAVPLLLMFSVAVRRVLRQSDDYLADLFLTAQTALAALLVISTGLQIAIVQGAAKLDTQVVYTVGVHFPGILITVSGFITGLAAFAYAFCIFDAGVLPRWTAYIAILSLVLCVGSTAGVFVPTGPFSLEGAFTAFAPAVSTVVWYLVVSVAIIRKQTDVATPQNG
nr:DUF4386 family protein [Mycobacterium kyorinense]